MRFIQAVEKTIVLLLLFRTNSSVFAVNNSTTHKFLLMVASGSSPDASEVVSAAKQALEVINRIFPFQLKYTINDTHVSHATYVFTQKQVCHALYSVMRHKQYKGFTMW